jgi:hypothetical protein
VVLKLPDCPPVLISEQLPPPEVEELELLLEEDEELEELLELEELEELLLDDELELLEPETVTLKACVLRAPQLFV